jgi:hypothetical protein
VVDFILVNYQQGVVATQPLVVTLRKLLVVALPAGLLLAAIGRMWMQQGFIGIIRPRPHHQFQTDSWQRILHFYHMQNKLQLLCA